jgi:dihydroxy-acid dehydratase
VRGRNSNEGSSSIKKYKIIFRFRKFVIAISWNTLIPGHFNFNQISAQVKKGIYRAGGPVYKFVVIGLFDALAKNIFNYVLPSREVICDSVEIRVEANPLDGIVLIG